MQPKTTDRSAAVQHRLLTGVLVAAAVTLSGCSSSDDASETQPLPDYEPNPVDVNAAASKVDPAELRLPLQLEDDTIVDPGWQTPPHSVDNMFLSAGGDDSVLTFRAVDDTGTIRWEAQRPISCSGFTLTSEDEQRYAVLADIDSETQDLGDTVVNAYELDTGENHWGPVPVPGPHKGPGTVFAAPPDQGMGDSGAKVLLDPATGDVLVDEAEQSEIIVLGEFHGTVLLVQDDQVQAHSAADLAETGIDATPQWTIDAADYGWQPEQLTAATPATVADPDHGAALIGTDNQDQALIDLTDGEVLAEQLADAGQDPSSGTWVTLGHQLVGYDTDGRQLYAHPNDDLDFAGVGAAMAYLKNADGDLEAHNVVTGDIGRAYRPDDTGTVAVPTIISPTGIGVVEADDRFYLSTPQ